MEVDYIYIAGEELADTAKREVFEETGEPCNITSRSLIISWLSESNKTTAQIKSVQYLVSVCIIA
jgi:8-oxo-dGTP pyrophosphatase MutT (NUDIX family)